MRVGLYTIRDIKADTYTLPFSSHNDNTARRTVADLKGDKATPYGKHPEDFQLFRLGSFDDTSAELELLQLTYIQEETL